MRLSGRGRQFLPIEDSLERQLLEYGEFSSREDVVDLDCHKGGKGKKKKGGKGGVKGAIVGVGLAFATGGGSLVYGAIGAAVGSGLVSKAIGIVGKLLAPIKVLDPISKELQRFAKNSGQVIKVLTGEYHDDAKKIEKEKKKVEKYGDYVAGKVSNFNLTLDQLQDRVDSLVAFDEIYKMAMGNRTEEFVELNAPEIDLLTAQYNAMVANLKRMVQQLKDEYDFVIGLTEGSFLQRIIGSVIMIVGGLMSDLGDIASGRANSATWKRIGTTIVMVIVIVVLIILLIPSGGLAAAPLSAVIAVVASIVSTFLALDGMYANGAATGAVMSALDFLFNDILNLDDIIGSDFEKFDKDHEDYQQMVGFVKLGIMLTGLIAAWMALPAQTGINAGTASVYGTEMGSQQTAQLAAQDMGIQANTASYFDGALQVGDSFGTSSLLGVKFSTFSDIYKAYTMASDIGDVVAMNDQHKQMQEKLEEQLEQVNEAIASKTNKRIMAHYKDASYFLQDQQEYIDRYVWSMIADSTYVDPYGTTPIANIRFEPDKDTRGLNFGFEDIFDESMMAGSKSYFNGIIYGM